MRRTRPWLALAEHVAEHNQSGMMFSFPVLDKDERV
jgi:hypothetical protein